MVTDVCGHQRFNCCIKLKSCSACLRVKGKKLTEEIAQAKEDFDENQDEMVEMGRTPVLRITMNLTCPAKAKPSALDQVVKMLERKNLTPQVLLSEKSHDCHLWFI